MATELGKAYVQIVPSAEGISSKIKEALGEPIASQGETSGESFAAKLTGTIKKAIAAAGIGTALKSAISEGAALEQSIGGIETLFKDSADTMKQYAAQAYQTAGISANDYMEQSTSFAASLLSSLGGDTAAAAETANQAIIDMADNSNKMGTSLQDIQNAYQGFAKQNYTMLDNLKLGYGGTKTEMERLLADAQELSGVEYNIDNLSDVYEAIHVIQENLDITGTTAKEAATTFSGSFAAMKAAAENFMGNLALGENVTEELQELVETTETFLIDNALPMLGNVLLKIPTLLPHAIEGVSVLITDIAAEIPGLMQTIFTEIGKGLGEWLASMGLFEQSGSIIKIFYQLGNAASVVTEGLGQVAGWIGEKLAAALPTAVDLITRLATAIGGALAAALPPLMDLIAQLAGWFSDTLGPVLQTVAESVETLATDIGAGLSAALPGVIDLLEKLGSALGERISQVLPTVVDLIAQLATAIGGALETALPTVMDLITQVVDAVANVVDTVLPPVIGFIENLAEFITSLVSEVLPPVIDIITEIAGILGDTIGPVLETVSGFVGDLFEVINENVMAVLPQVSEAIGTLAGWLADKIEPLLPTLQNYTEKLTSVFSTLAETIGSILAPIIEGIGERLSAFIDWITGTSASAEAVRAVFSAIADLFVGALSTAFNVIGTVAEVVAGVLAGLGNVVASVLEWFKSLSSNTTVIWNSIKTTTTNVWNGIKTAIMTPINTAKTTVLSAIDGIKTNITSKFNAIKTTATSVWNAIKTAITTPITTAKDTVKTMIDKIKGFFNFTWSLPKLKLPHFSITGSFGINPPSVPHFSISWYKKAMDEPMILNGATIFGAAGGNLLGGGEAGAEVVAGADTLNAMMQNAAYQANAETQAQTNERLDKLIALLAGGAGINITINGADYRSKQELAEAVVDLITRTTERKVAALA